MENYKLEKILIHEQVAIINDTIDSLVSMGGIDPIDVNCGLESKHMEQILQVKANYEDLIEEFNLRNKNFLNKKTYVTLHVSNPLSKENLIKALKVSQSQFMHILSELDESYTLNTNCIVRAFTVFSELDLEKIDLVKQELKIQQLEALRNIAFELDGKGS